MGTCVCAYVLTALLLFLHTSYLQSWSQGARRAAQDPDSPGRLETSSHHLNWMANRKDRLCYPVTLKKGRRYYKDKQIGLQKEAVC